MSVENTVKKIQVIREIQDKIVKEAIQITERFKVLPFPLVNEILAAKLSRITLSAK